MVVSSNMMINDQMVVLRLKCELAKEKSKHQSVQEELKVVKSSLSNEIHLLQETIELQREVITELQKRSDLKETAWEMAGEQVGIAENESDFTTEIWDLCESTRIQDVEQEGFKMVFQLSQEIDELKENLSSSDEELIHYKEDILRLQASLLEETDRSQSVIKQNSTLMEDIKNLSEENDKLYEDNDKLCEDILTLTDIHEKQVHQLSFELQSQRIHSESVEAKLDSCRTTLRRTADYMSWWRILQQYVVVV